MNLCTLESIGVVLSLIVSLVSLMTCLRNVLRTVIFSDDNFVLKIPESGQIIFYNNGKYDVVIKEISIWEKTGEPVLEGLYKEIKIVGRNKRKIFISFNSEEFINAKEKHETLFLCFNIESDSGEDYELAYRMLDKNKSIKLGKVQLNKELPVVLDD